MSEPATGAIRAETPPPAPIGTIAGVREDVATVEEGVSR